MFNTQYSTLIFLFVLTLFERRVLRIPSERRKTLAETSIFRIFSVKHETARLACVRHAASVRPEPGSNSQINI